VMHRHRKSAWL